MKLSILFSTPSKIDLISQHLSCLLNQRKCFSKQWASRISQMSWKYWRLISKMTMMPIHSLQSFNYFQRSCESINLKELVKVSKSLSGEKHMLVRNCVIITRIILTTSATSAPPDRSFSMLRRIKTWLQSIMAQKRLNYLSILYDSKSILDDILLLHLTNEFFDHHTDQEKLCLVLQFYSNKSVDLCIYFVYNLMLFLSVFVSSI